MFAFLIPTLIRNKNDTYQIFRLIFRSSDCIEEVACYKCGICGYLSLSSTGIILSFFNFVEFFFSPQSFIFSCLGFPKVQLLSSYHLLVQQQWFPEQSVFYYGQGIVFMLFFFFATVLREEKNMWEKVFFATPYLRLHSHLVTSEQHQDCKVSIYRRFSCHYRVGLNYSFPGGLSETHWRSLVVFICTRLLVLLQNTLL